jgi:YD repeat-containing protein
MRTTFIKKIATGLLGFVLINGFVGSAIGGTTSYQYDSLGRVIKVVYPDLKQICYTYDSAGNRTQVKRQATGSCTVTGSTLTSSLTAEKMFAAQQGNEQLVVSESAIPDATAADSQIATDSVTTGTSATDQTAATN